MIFTKALHATAQKRIPDCAAYYREHQNMRLEMNWYTDRAGRLTARWCESLEERVKQPQDSFSALGSWTDSPPSNCRAEKRVPRRLPLQKLTLLSLKIIETVPA
jgi:hypothetical protein